MSAAADAVAVVHGLLVLAVFVVGLGVPGPWAFLLVFGFAVNQALDPRGMCILTRWENRLRGVPEEGGQGFVHGLISRAVAVSPSTVYGVLTVAYMAVCAYALVRTNNKMYRHFALYWVVVVVALYWSRPRAVKEGDGEDLSNPRVLLLAALVAALLCATNAVLK